jgi:hypothetical protein
MFLTSEDVPCNPSRLGSRVLRQHHVVHPFFFRTEMISRVSWQLWDVLHAPVLSQALNGFSINLLCKPCPHNITLQPDYKCDNACIGSSLFLFLHSVSIRKILYLIEEKWENLVRSKGQRVWSYCVRTLLINVSIYHRGYEYNEVAQLLTCYLNFLSIKPMSHRWVKLLGKNITLLHQAASNLKAFQNLILRITNKAVNSR